jgi:hypothetical protein
MILYPSADYKNSTSAERLRSPLVTLAVQPMRRDRGTQSGHAELAKQLWARLKP